MNDQKCKRYLASFSELHQSRRALSRILMIKATFSVLGRVVSLHFYHWSWQYAVGLAIVGENTYLTQGST